MIAQCAALLTATVLLTTGSLASDANPPVEDTRAAMVQSVTDVNELPPTHWAAYYGDDDDDEGDGIDYAPQRRPQPRYQDPRYQDESRGYQRRYDPRDQYDPRDYPRPYPRGYGSYPNGSDSRGGYAPGYDQRPTRDPFFESRQARPAAPAAPRAQAAPSPRRKSVLNQGSYELTPVAPPSDGRVHIDVNKAGQFMIVTTTSGQRYHWPISTGMDGYETGETKNTVIHANEGDKDHRSKEYHGAPMPFVMWWNTTRGLGIHGTDLNSQLGQTASHGCIRLSRTHARKLFYWVMASAGVLNIR